MKGVSFSLKIHYKPKSSKQFILFRNILFLDFFKEKVEQSIDENLLEEG